MLVRANALWKKQLAAYEPPALDPAIDEALLDYMNRRKASFADSKY
jgi:trimethylamine--corrinoid protein Co-methyltransferase